LKDKPRAAEAPRKLKTLDRILSKLGAGSRTEAAGWIRAGRVRVNGATAKDPEAWFDIEGDRFHLDGRPLRGTRKLYLLLYKPKGYLTTYHDPAGRPTVYDLLREVKQWVFPVGRLDLDTSGLLLLTNDAPLAERVTNPDYHVPKTYLVKASRLLTDQELDQLARGVELKDGMTRPAQVKRLRDGARCTFFEMTIREGRNRQVRRMVEALDAKILKLVRVALGPLRIGDLASGHWRRLQPQELKALQTAGRGRPHSARPAAASASP
jgi:pseudouridine synthase